MAWFRRKQRRDAAGSAGAAGEPSSPAASAAVAGGSPEPPRRRVASQAWTSLPVLAPTVSPAAPKVGEADQFVAGLTARQPLVHPPVLFGRSGDAPRGVVDGLAVALPVDIEASEPWPDLEPEHSTLAPPIEPEPRRVIVVDSSPTSEPLTRVAADAIAQVQAPPAAPPPPPFPTMAADVAPAEPATRVEDPMVPSDPFAFLRPPEPASEPAPPLHAPAPRLNLGQSRRAGLGAPLGEPPGVEQYEAEVPDAEPLPSQPLGVAVGPTFEGAVRPARPPAVEPPPSAPSLPPSPLAPGQAAMRHYLGPALTGAVSDEEATDTAARHPEPLATAPTEEEPRPEPPAMVHPPVATAATDQTPGGEPAPGLVMPVFRPPAGAEPVVIARPADRARDIATEMFEASARLRTEPVPQAVRAELRRLHRVDIGDKPVRRGPEVTEQAKSVGARAFAKGEEVFLPAEEGPLESPVTRGMLAHELTHVLQQRELGPRLPAEDSPGGQLLEAHAAEAERWFAGEPGATEPAPLTEVTHRRLPVVERPLSELVAMVTGELLRGAKPGDDDAIAAVAALAPPLAPTIAGAGVVASGVQRQGGKSSAQALGEFTNALKSGRELPSISPSDIESFESEARSRTIADVRDEMEQVLADQGKSQEEIDAFLDDLEASGGLLGGGGGLGGGAMGKKKLQERLADLHKLRAEAAAAGMGFYSEDWAEVDKEINDLEAKVAEAGGDEATTKSSQVQRIEELHKLREEAIASGVIAAPAVWGEVDSEIRRLEAEEATRLEEEEQKKAEKERAGKARLLKGEGLAQGEREEQAAELLEHFDMDDLANRLYARLRSRLRTELLVDRERAGLLADFR